MITDIVSDIIKLGYNVSIKSSCGNFAILCIVSSKDENDFTLIEKEDYAISVDDIPRALSECTKQLVEYIIKGRSLTDN